MDIIKAIWKDKYRVIECVKQFQNVGIKLSAQDFDVSEYAKNIWIYYCKKLIKVI